jgi:hypothetical protein
VFQLRLIDFIYPGRGRGGIGSSVYPPPRIPFPGMGNPLFKLSWIPPKKFSENFAQN